MADGMVNNNPDLDLGVATIRYLRLLTKIHFRGRKTKGRHGDEDQIFNAIYRYENCWLPLLSENNSGSVLKPPWDVYYVWCLHILTSAKYRDYCRNKYGCLLDHVFQDNVKEEDMARERAKEIWESRFPEEQFEANPKSSVTMPNSELNKVIIESEEKQATFHYQILLSHFHDRTFIGNAVDRYQKLLLLKQEHPAADLCPMHDLEMIRQAHILHPQQYERDLERILGMVEEFTTMERAFNAVQSYDFEEKSAIETTRRLWSVKYKTSYDVAGIKHRGLPDEAYITQATQIHLRQTEPETIMVSLDQIKIADLWSRDQKITIEARKLGKTAYTYDVLYRVSGKSGESISCKNISSASQRFSFSLRENRAIELHTFGTKGRFCMKKEEHVATTYFDPRKLYEEGEKIRDKELLVEVPRVSYGDPTVSFQCKINVVNRAKPHMFTLYREPFTLGPIPKDLKPFIKLDSWTDIDTFAMDTFHTARHSVRTSGAWGSNFICQVVSCRDLDLGGILLYEDGTELVTVAHTVSNDQLPLPEQVSSKYVMSLDRISGQHAMLIRNHFGDWGLCIVKEDPEIEGGVTISFENLQQQYVKQTTFTFQTSTLLIIDDMSVDLQTGQVTLKSDCAEAAEYVTLAYVIGVLYVFTSGHQVPEVPQRQISRNSAMDSAALTAGVGNASRAKSKASMKTYDISTRSIRKGPSVTLSNLKSRRKKKTLVCTMLLACGLQANMMVEEDLTRMSFHSEVSLLGKSENDDEIPSSHGMDDIHRHSFYNELNENARELNETRRDEHFNSFLTVPGNDQFTFRKPDVNQHEAATPNRTSVVPRETSTGAVTPRESWIREAEEDLYDVADFSGITPISLEDRARDIVDKVMANAVMEVGNHTTPNSKFISEGDELPNDDVTVVSDGETDSEQDSDSDDLSFTYTLDFSDNPVYRENPAFVDDIAYTDEPEDSEITVSNVKSVAVESLALGNGSNPNTSISTDVTDTRL